MIVLRMVRGIKPSHGREAATLLQEFMQTPGWQPKARILLPQYAPKCCVVAEVEFENQAALDAHDAWVMSLPVEMRQDWLKKFSALETGIGSCDELWNVVE
jgi:hypothetical protein